MGGSPSDPPSSESAAHKRIEVRGWAIHRGTFGSVKELNTKIRAFIDGRNDRAHPFVSTLTAGQILEKAKRPTNRKSDQL